MRFYSHLHRVLSRHGWLILGSLALFSTCRLPALTGWDDAFYIAQLTSAVVDHDLLLQDDLFAFPRPLSERLRSITTILDSGAVQNTFSIGFAAVHGVYAWPVIALSERRIGEPLRRLLAVGSLGVLILTTLAMVRLGERWGFSANVSRMATALTLASSPLALFGTRVYLNSHLLGAFLAALVLLGALRTIEGGHARDALFTGVASGFLAINRWEDGLLLLALAPALMVNRGGDLQRPRLKALGAATGGFLAVCVLQLLAWRAQFGAWLLIPQGGGYLNWRAPHIFQLVTSPYHGLLPWAPGLALGLALAPFLVSPRETKGVQSLRRGLLLSLPLFLYSAAAPRDWWGGDSYGPRRLATLAPVAVLGLAALLERLRPQLRLILAGLLGLWSVITLSAYFSGFDD